MFSVFLYNQQCRTLFYMTTDWDVAFYDTSMRKKAPAFLAPFLKECHLKGSDCLLKMEANGLTWEIK